MRPGSICGGSEPVAAVNMLGNTNAPNARPTTQIARRPQIIRSGDAAGRAFVRSVGMAELPGRQRTIKYQTPSGRRSHRKSGENTSLPRYAGRGFAKRL